MQAIIVHTALHLRDVAFVCFWKSCRNSWIVDSSSADSQRIWGKARWTYQVFTSTWPKNGRKSNGLNVCSNASDAWKDSHGPTSLFLMKTFVELQVVRKLFIYLHSRMFLIEVEEELHLSRKKCDTTQENPRTTSNLLRCILAGMNASNVLCTLEVFFLWTLVNLPLCLWSGWPGHTIRVLCIILSALNTTSLLPWASNVSYISWGSCTAVIAKVKCHNYSSNNERWLFTFTCLF